MLILGLTFMTVFVAEMGDKTQLLLVAMAGKYKVRDILMGTWSATAVLNLLAVAIGAALNNYIDLRIVKTLAAVAFLYFSWSTFRDVLNEEDSEEENFRTSGKLGVIAAIFTSFFIGELGDKTQLSAITLAASYSDGSLVRMLMVFLGCTLGLIVADYIGLLFGLFLKSRLPTRSLGFISAVIFAIFGLSSCVRAGKLIFPETPMRSAVMTAIIFLIYLIMCAVSYFGSRSEYA